ncbi:MAG: hypothetical protein F6J93_12770 [Oscillatoria sp. SIO1A7]|nr:hypothetical protein [Oscillatoria sp. SIO1A7]
MAEAQPLAGGLVEICQNPDRVLEEILHWTAGKPFLTQKICQAIAEGEFIAAGDEAARVAGLVQEKTIKNWESQDVPEHLKIIRDRLLIDDGYKNRRLEIYQTILEKNYVSSDETVEQRQLRLSGALVEREGRLEIANPIYKTIFDLNWVETELANMRS